MERRVIALGFFDGVHKGHKALMDKAARIAKEENAISAVFTFDKHPASLVSGISPAFILPTQYREEEIKTFGQVDEVITAKFDEEFMKMPWQDFIDYIVKEYGVIHIITGENNHFGYKGQGDSIKLAAYCKENKIGYSCINDVKIDNKVVSSSLIRSFIKDGEMEKATKFLGHNFAVVGTVSGGKKLGRQIGVPTVNVKMPLDMEMPPFGVYKTIVTVDGKEYLAATNLGINPTFMLKEPVIEANLFDFNSEIYGETVRVEFIKFIRRERRFSTVEELKGQIEKDIKEIRGGK